MSLEAANQARNGIFVLPSLCLSIDGLEQRARHPLEIRHNWEDTLPVATTCGCARKHRKDKRFVAFPVIAFCVLMV
jgi:hypothetical protein